MTLNGNIRTLFQSACVFGAHHENLNEDRPILSAAKTKRNDRNFWQYAYKVHADIHGGSFGDEASNDSGVIENVDFQGFRTLRIGTLVNEANIFI